MRYLPLILLACVAIAGLTTPAAAADYGDLTGTFVYDGTPPVPPKIVPTKDLDVCGKHPLVDENVIVGKDGGIRDVVVRLFLPLGAKAPTPHPDYEKTAKDAVRIDNLNCRFEPHVVLLRTTQKLIVGNKDPIAHNSAINSIVNPAQNPLLPANSDLTINSFVKAERMPVKVACSIHPWMGGTIVVSDHPYMAVTDETGKFTIKNIPVGKHTFQAWHEKGYVTAAGAAGKVEVTIEAGKAKDIGTIKVKPEFFMK